MILQPRLLSGLRLRGIWAACALLASPPGVSALDPSKSVFQYNIQNWSRQDGLPSDKVGAIAQTNDGYVWLGTQNGLIRFDGVEFTVVPIDLAEAGGQEVRHLAASREGGLWFAIAGGGFGYYDGRAFSPALESRQAATDVDAKVVLETREGAVWFGADRDLVRRPARRMTLERPNPTTTRVASAIEDLTGRVWIGTEEEGLHSWSGGKLSAMPDEALRAQLITALGADGEGNIWVGTQRGLRRYEVAERRLLSTYLGSSRITALLVDREKTLWIGTTSGLARYRDGEFTFLRKVDGLGSDYVTALLEDREGSLWVGRRDGLSQLTDLKFPIYSPKEGLNPGGGLTVSAARKGGIWVTMTHGISYFDGRRFTNYSAPILSNIYVKLGLEARNGDFYYVDGDKTISVMSAGKVTARYQNTEWPEALAEDDESVIVGIGPSLHRIKDGAVQPYRFEGPPPDFQWFDNLMVARDNAIWVACYSGVYRVKDGTFQHWGADEGLSGNRVHYVYEDVDGSIWAGLSTGLARIKGGQIRNITAANGLHDNRIYAIVPDDSGYFWINSGHGIFRVAREELNRFADGKVTRIECEPFDGLDSVKFTDRVDQEYSGCRSVDGRIWFPNPWGFVMVDPANFVRNAVPPLVHIERIRVSGSKTHDRSNAKLEVGDERLEFQFSALSFIAAKKVRLRYQLEGFDPEWIEAGGRRSALYNLAPGAYTFRVQAANADGVWNTAGDTFAFVLPPPFHRTSWFYGLCSLGGVLSLFGAYGWKVQHFKVRQRNLQKANELLEAKVHERTAEVAYERDLLRALLENSPDAIFFKDTESRFVKVAHVFAERLGVSSPRELVGKTDFDFFAREHAQASLDDEQDIIRTGQPLVGKVEKEMWTNGRVTWVITTKVPWRDKDGKIIGTFGLAKDITSIKESEAKLIELHKQLLETSRQAGMAEVATGVLHNVGNVLNSVNVSTTLLSDQVRQSKLTHIRKLHELLRKHEADLGGFFTQDPRGRQLPSFLGTLADHLENEQTGMLGELEQLRKNVEHIKDIVAMQQNYAKVSGVTEIVAVEDLVEDAVRMNSGAFARHDVSLVREFQATPPVTTEKHKILQILVNLMRNAKYACDDSGRTDKQITLSIKADERVVRIAVKDNGVGIAAENLTRIFGHGFTTRKHGHGFGLHSGALAARELGGSLTAHSDGPGQGATFTLEIPLQSEARA